MKYSDHTGKGSSAPSIYASLERQMQKQLSDIALAASKRPHVNFPQTAEGKRRIMEFDVSLTSQRMKSKLGDYRPKHGAALPRITIFDVEGETWKNVLITAIHELSHHIDTIARGSSAHDDTFYAIHKHLLFTCFDMGILNKSDVTERESRSRNKNKLGAMMEEYASDKLVYREDMMQVRVYDAYEARETLKEMRFSWNPIDAAWVKFIMKIELSDLRTALSAAGVAEPKIIVISSPAVITRLRKRVTVSNLTPGDALSLGKLRFKPASGEQGAVWKLLPIGQQMLPPEEFKTVKAIRGSVLTFA